MRTAIALCCSLLLFAGCGPTSGDVGRPGNQGNPGNQGGQGNPSAGGSTGGGNVGGFVFGMGGTNSPPVMPPPETCGASKQEAKVSPLAIFILLDQSGSMTEGSDLWSPVTTALLTFIDSADVAGVEVALQYFPLGATMVEDAKICAPTNYTVPAVPFGSLPQAAAALRANIQAHHFTSAQAKDPAHWGTPTGPAVDGVLQYMKQWKANHAEHRVALVLATDGQPSRICTKNTIDDIASRLATAFASPEAITTFVVGIGKIERLDALAAAGGTGQKAFVVEGAGGAKTQTDFVNALVSIRKLSLPCDYALPAATMGALNINEVNVDVQKGASSVPFVRVTNTAACGTRADAWHYDDPVSPTKLQLCPQACEAVRMAATKVEIAVGCEARVVL